MDTADEVTRVSFKRVHKDFDNNAIVATNANIPYLVELRVILEASLPTVCLYRDPMFALASWSAEKTRSFPEFRVLPYDLSPRWSSFEFVSADRLGRQAELWRHFALIIRSRAHRGDVALASYERTADQPFSLVEIPGLDLSAELEEADLGSFANLNRQDRFPEFDFEAADEACRRHGLVQIYEDLREIEGRQTA
jgi:hypothetical protein